MQKVVAASTWMFTAAQTASNLVTKIGAKRMMALGLIVAALHHFLVDPGSPPLYIALLLVAGGILILGQVSNATAPKIALAGLGVALFGAGVWLTGLGIEFMVDAMIKLFNAVSANLAGFAMFGIILGGILVGLGVLGPLAAAGIAVLGVSLLVFGPMMAAGIVVIAASIWLLGRAINSIDKDVMISFKAFSSGFETLAKLPSGESATFDRMVNTIAEIEPAHVENIQDIVDETQRYIAVQATAKLMGITPLIDALTKGEEGTRAGAQGQQQPQPVTIVLDVPGQHQLRLAGKLLVDKGYFGAPSNAPKQY
jgi:hypothetical protein